jgi:hypothetical protein
MAGKKITTEEVVEDQVVEIVEEVETVEVEEVVEEGFTANDMPAADPMFVVAGEQDSYPALAERLAPEGVKPRDFAQTLIALNNGAPVRPGKRIRINR